MGENTKTSMQKFEDQNGKAARIIVVALAGPPFLLCIAFGAIAGVALALPGLALAVIAAIPHWLTRTREGQS